jgi:archaellum biogenesis ATPase FlaH
VNQLDAHGIVRAALLRSSYGARKSGKAVAFRCPRHADSTASAWLGDHAWGCAACGFTEPLGTLAELLGVELPKTSGGTGLTLAEYAERKGLALDGLRKAGVEEREGKYGDPLVAIPYRRADGTVIRTKCRTRKGTFWLNDGEGTPLYGQDVLASTTGPVLVVEGESDCHAGWQRGLCVVGLPGASQWKAEYTTLFMGREVIVWQEPDEGGATMVAAIAKSLPKAKVLREVMVEDQRIKDLCDLHQAVQQLGLDWHTTWRNIVASATPIGAEPPAVTFDSLSGDTLEQILTEKLAPIDAVPTPLPEWNALCHGGGGGVGLSRGWLVTIGANTGTGKSLIGINMASHAIRQGEVVTFISLEMGRSELATRLLAVVSDESVVGLEQGPLFNAASYAKAALTLDDVRQATGGHVLVNRRPISRLKDIDACVKYHAEVHGSRYFVVDYLQLAQTSPSHSEFERITQVQHTLRELTQTHRVITVALSQFNRQTSANRAERPTSQGLMGGSAIENDSHQVVLFDHSRFTRTGNLADTWLIIDKNRHGGVKDLAVQWDYRTLRLHPRQLSIAEQEAIHGQMLPRWKERR